ncbi:unnamed protein product [Prunus armeniaca]
MAEEMVVCDRVRHLGLAVGCDGSVCRDGLCDGVWWFVEMGCEMALFQKGMGCAVELVVNLMGCAMGCVCKMREFSIG